MKLLLGDGSGGDLLISWYYCRNKDDVVYDTFERDCWQVIESASQRLSKVDFVRFLCCDVVKKVTEHYEKLRAAKCADAGDVGGGFVVHPQVMCPQREMEYLRKLSELVILLLFPRQYATCKITRKFIKQILSKYVLLPLLDIVTDPNYINRWILKAINKTDVMDSSSKQSTKITSPSSSKGGKKKQVK